MNQKPKVFIGGDSWGCGEWVHSLVSGPHISHKGLEQYFLDSGYVVVNTAKGGSSNSKSIHRLDKMNISDKDVVLWIQTDPMRNVDSMQIREGFRKFNSFIKFMEFLLYEDYKNLNAIGEKNNIKIHLIGGMTNVLENITSGFSNLNTLVQSWNHLLIGHIPEYSEWKSHLYLGIMSRHIDDFSLDLYSQDEKFKLVDEIDNAIWKKWNMHHALSDVYPDGNHPTREGHKILFDYVVKELKL